MKNLIQYRYTVEEAFFKYLKKQFTLDDLMAKLRWVESMASDDIGDDRDSDKGLWFKFGKFGTVANTLSNFEETLKNGTRENKEFLLECMQMACTLDPNSEVQIFYS